MKTLPEQIHATRTGDPSVGPFGLARYGHMSTVWSAGDDRNGGDDNTFGEDWVFGADSRCHARNGHHRTLPEQIHATSTGDPSVGPFGLARYGHMSTVWSAGDDKMTQDDNTFGNAMHNSISFSIILLCIILLFSLANTEEAEMDLQAAIATAWANNANILSSQLQIKSAKVVRTKANATLQPSLSAGTSIQRSQVLFANSYQTSWSANLSLTETLNRQNLASIETAKRQEKAVTLDVKTIQEDLAKLICQAYTQALRDSMLVQAKEANLETQRQKLAQIKAFVTGGSLPPSDTLVQLASMAQAELLLADTRKTSEDSRDALFSLLGTDANATQYRITDFPVQAVDAILQTNPSTGENEDSIQTSSLVAQAARIEAARAALTETTLGWWPTLQFGATLGHTDPLGNSTAGANLSSSNSLRVDASLSLPLLDREARTTSKVSAQISLTSANLRLRDLQQQQKTARNKEARNYASALVRYSLAQIALTSAQAALAVVQSKFSSGATTQLDLRSAEQQALQAQTDLVSARYNAVLAFIGLKHSQGQIHTALVTLGASL
jgi:outer membrane protein